MKFAICKPPLQIIIDEKLYLCQNDFHNLHSVTSLLYFTGLSINSTILSNIGSFLGNLSHFLAPAVGSTSRWLLCHRASTHGWAVSTFHTSCDHKPNTVTIIKKGQYVFGGYTDITWGKNFNLTSNSLCLERPNWVNQSLIFPLYGVLVSGPLTTLLPKQGTSLNCTYAFVCSDSAGYGDTSNAFIFSLRNKEVLHPFKSMVITPGNAIHGCQGCGPTFGCAWDIYISDNANSNNDSYTYLSCYETPKGANTPATILSGTRHFSPDDWEVFYLG